jgi:nucleoside-diphosphate-sugar epimerase
MKIAVTGAGGYIGSQLVRDLLSIGHTVVGIDRYFFGTQVLNNEISNKNFQMIKKDIRDLNPLDLENVDVLCDLACLSNDPSGEIDENLTYQINRDGRINVAVNAKKAGVKKYILSSSCSVYGEGLDENLTELSKTNPISAYAKSTLQAENETFGLSNSNFAVTALRNATVFGLSNRMRFDLVVNLMTLSAFQKKRIIVMGGGLQWRPLVHVSDVSAAFMKVIESDEERINQEIFNIGLENYQIKQIAYMVRDNFSLEVDIEIAPDDADKRNYKVNFEKAREVIGFTANKSVGFGVEEILNALRKGTIETGIKTVTVEWYKHILDASKLLKEITLNDRVL